MSPIVIRSRIRPFITRAADHYPYDSRRNAVLSRLTRQIKPRHRSLWSRPFSCIRTRRNSLPDDTNPRHSVVPADGGGIMKQLVSQHRKPFQLTLH